MEILKITMEWMLNDATSLHKITAVPLKNLKWNLGKISSKHKTEFGMNVFSFNLCFCFVSPQPSPTPPCLGCAVNILPKPCAFLKDFLRKRRHVLMHLHLYPRGKKTFHCYVLKGPFALQKVQSGFKNQIRKEVDLHNLPADI
jgi:hypothetical protein